MSDDLRIVSGEVAADPLREKLQALVEEWRLRIAETPRSYAEYSEDEVDEIIGEMADQLAALLAESEPNPGKTHYQGDDCPGGHESKCGYCGSPCERCTQPAEPVLKLGHEFERAYHSESFCVAPGKCHKVVGIKVCGQPREAH